ncbi:MAG: hypothetical protein HC913_05595 [Microscillaceae bacterium]|nr:hypothetical protein [Microscillaceae bacterium]
MNDYGGAIKIRSRSKIIIKNTLFLDNQSFQNGGALYNTLSDLEMINCQFRQNKTASSGGGAYVDGGRGDNGQVVFDQCIFDSNESGLAIEGGAGGGLYLYSYNLGKAWVKNCTFKNNYAHGEKGYGGGLDYSSETLITEHSEYPYTNTGNDTYLFLHNSAFYNNHSNYLGGGIIFGRGEGEMVNCTVAYNSAIRTSNTGGTGGGLYLNDFELSIANCTIAYNITKGNAGGIATSQEVTA